MSRLYASKVGTTVGYESLYTYRWELDSHTHVHICSHAGCSRLSPDRSQLHAIRVFRQEITIQISFQLLEIIFTLTQPWTRNTRTSYFVFFIYFYFNQLLLKRQKKINFRRYIYENAWLEPYFNVVSCSLCIAIAIKCTQNYYLYFELVIKIVHVYESNIYFAVSREEAARSGAEARSRRMLRKLCSSSELPADDVNGKRMKASHCSSLASRGSSSSRTLMFQTSGKRSASKKSCYEVSRQPLDDDENSESSSDESKENDEPNAPAAKNVPVIKNVDVWNNKTFKMVFSHAVVKFNCSKRISTAKALNRLCRGTGMILTSKNYIMSKLGVIRTARSITTTILWIGLDIVHWE